MVLFNNRQIHNIANFCCTEETEFKSSLGTKPSYYVLVTTYKNASLYAKGSEVCPTMLGPVLVCHKKDEDSVRFLCHQMTSFTPGLEKYISIFGADGEQSVINTVCQVFSRAVLLLYYKHEQDNCLRNMPAMPEPHKKAIMADLFGDTTHEGLVDCNSFEEYNIAINNLHQEWESNYGNPGKSFSKYLRRTRKRNSSIS